MVCKINNNNHDTISNVDWFDNYLFFRNIFNLHKLIYQ